MNTSRRVRGGQEKRTSCKKKWKADKSVEVDPKRAGQAGSCHHCSNVGAPHKKSECQVLLDSFPTITLYFWTRTSVCATYPRKRKEVEKGEAEKKEKET